MGLIFTFSRNVKTDASIKIFRARSRYIYYWSCRRWNP